VGQIRHFGHGSLLVLALELALTDVGLEAAVEVVGADAGVDDGEDDEDDGDDGEGGKGFTDRHVGEFAQGFVHADELEEEVGQGGEIEHLCGTGEQVSSDVGKGGLRDGDGWAYDDEDHAWCALFPCEVSCHQEDDDGYGHRHDGECEFSVVDVDHNDQELYGEPKEEEEIEFEKGNVDLANQPQHTSKFVGRQRTQIPERSSTSFSSSDRR